MDNFEKLEHAVNFMNRIVPPYVKEKMQDKYGGKALTMALQIFGQKNSEKEVSKAGKPASTVLKALQNKGFNALDLYASLKIIVNQRQLFEEKMGEEAWAYGQRMLYYRNHIKGHDTADLRKEFNAETDDETIKMYLKEIVVFCTPINAMSDYFILPLLNGEVRELPGGKDKDKDKEKDKDKDKEKDKDKDKEKDKDKNKDTDTTKKEALFLTRGMEVPLNEHCDINKEVKVTLYIQEAPKGTEKVTPRPTPKYLYSFVCLDKDNHIVENYVISDDCTTSLNEEIRYEPGKTGNFHVDFSKLPAAVQTIELIARVDGEGTMKDTKEHKFKVAQNNKNFMHFKLTGEDFGNETSVVSVRFCREDKNWKICAVGDNPVKLTRGMRKSLNECCDVTKEVNVSLCIQSEPQSGLKSLYSFVCLDKDNHIIEEYSVSDSNQNALHDAISYALSDSGNIGNFRVNFSQLPETVNKMELIARIDGSGTMKDIKKHKFKIAQNERNFMCFELTGKDFGNQTSIVSVEFYRKDKEWRIWAVADGNQ